MDVGLILDLMPVASFVGTIALGIWTFLISGNKANSEAIAALDKRVDEKAGRDDLQDLDIKFENMDRRVQAIEGEMRHLPGKDDVNAIKVALAGFDGKFGEYGESLRGLRRSVDRIEGYLTSKVP